MADPVISGSLVPQPINQPPGPKFNKLAWFTKGFRPHFNDWIFTKQLDRLVYSDHALVSFIFMSCVIDYLTGFWRGGETTGQGYRDFVDKYFPTGRYSAIDLYDSLRNGLVHMFTIKNKKYGLTHNNPGLHLHRAVSGQVILNASNLRDDLYIAAQMFFDDVEQNAALLENVFTRYNSYGFLDLGNLKLI